LLSAMSDPLILGIETSGILCSIAWWKNNEVLLEFNIERKNAHATLLAQLVENGMQELNIIPEDLSCIAISSGPGSFTGLRIGMSYAKGLSYGTDIPLVPVSNFEILAHTIKIRNIPVYTLIDARKNNYYTGVFNKNNSNLDEQYLLNITQIEKIVPENANIIIHEEQHRGVFAQTYQGKANILKGDYGAVITCSIAHQKFLKGDFTELERIEPLYLQAFAGVL